MRESEEQLLLSAADPERFVQIPPHLFDDNGDVNGKELTDFIQAQNNKKLDARWLSGQIASIEFELFDDGNPRADCCNETFIAALRSLEQNSGTILSTHPTPSLSIRSVLACHATIDFAFFILGFSVCHFCFLTPDYIDRHSDLNSTHANNVLYSYAVSTIPGMAAAMSSEIALWAIANRTGREPVRQMVSSCRLWCRRDVKPTQAIPTKGVRELTDLQRYLNQQNLTNEQKNALKIIFNVYALSLEKKLATDQTAAVEVTPPAVRENPIAHRVIRMELT